MSNKWRLRHTPEQVVRKLRDADAMLNAGRAPAAVLQALEVSEATLEVLISIPKNVISIRSILREVERLVLEDADQIGKPIDHFLATAELGGVVEVREVGELVRLSNRGEDLLIDRIPDPRLPLEGDHVFER